MAAKKPREHAEAAYQVGPDVVVTLEYSVFDAEGEEVGGSDGAREFLIGYGELLPAVERALEGLTPGSRRSIRLAPKDAFGARDPRAQIRVDRSEFPADVAPGDHFEAEAESGDPIVLRVLDVEDDEVVIDQNHPLAGQTLRVEARVMGTRPASGAERSAAAARLEETAKGAESPLIPAERLLRGPVKR